MPNASASDSVIVRHLDIQEYEPTWQAMQSFTQQRDSDSQDEIWLLQHPPVFTQGLAGKAEHLLDPGNIPVLGVDRGGQITYHGPGQIVGYLLIDLKRRGLGVRQLVRTTEIAIMDLLNRYGVSSSARTDAPGVYIDGRKIASLGFRVRRGCSFHGLSLNVDMDLSPFERINPCGHEGLEVIDMRQLNLTYTFEQVTQDLLQQLLSHFGYRQVIEHHSLPQTTKSQDAP